MIAVWHAISPNWGLTSLGPSPKWPAGFNRVANVFTDSLDIAFRQTNHIDTAWTENEDVEVIPNGKLPRSTSVGDILVKDGVAYQCMFLGWEKVEQ